MNYSARSQIRVAHPFAQFAERWGIARSATVLLCLVSAYVARAEESPCGLTSVHEGVAAYYPPMGRAAHVEGTLIFMVDFAPDGNVVKSTSIAGPLLLANTTKAYVDGLQANPYTGPRECPVVLAFHLIGPTDRECTEDEKLPQPIIERQDLQHISLTAKNGCLVVMRDPAPWRQHRVLFFHWYSKP